MRVIAGVIAEKSLPDSDAPAASGIPVIPGQYSRLREQLVHAVRRVCPSWLAQDAEDLVQDALIRVMQRTRSSDGTLVVSPAYLKKVAYSTVVDEIRRRQRRPDVVAGQDGDEVADDAPATGDPLLGNAIAGCLAQQHADRRRAVTLHLLGHSVAEAASTLGCNVKRAENLVYRGLAQLRDCLNQRGIQP